MQTLNRLIAVFLVLSMLVCIVPAQAAQAEDASTVCGHSCESPAISPPTITIEEHSHPRTRGIVYHTDEDAAAAVLRQAMVNRTATIQVGFQMKEMTQEAVNYIFSALFKKAVAHTGVGTEGDMLERVYGGYGGSVSYSKSGGIYYSTLTYNMTYYTTAAQEAVLDSYVKAFLEQHIREDMTDYEKFRVIYEWICANVVYDYDHDDTYKLKYTAYAAMVNKTSVCQGYACLLYRLLLECGIDCRYISGQSGGGSHGWNIVKIDGLYYNADPTWDAGRDPAAFKYCLRADSTFEDHTRNTQFTTTDFYAQYPMSSIDYSTKNLSYHATLAEAAAELRKAMVNRETTVTVALQLQQRPTDAELDTLMEMAWAHTGVPNEGDYLHYHCKNYKTSCATFDTEDGCLTAVTYSISYYSTQAQEEQLRAAIDDFLASKIQAGMTDYQKFDAIYSWMCQNIAYSSATPTSPYSAYTAMIGRSASASGHTALLYRLLLECGIDCRTITGTVNDGATHRWNIVRLNSLYYNADPGWDSYMQEYYSRYYYRLLGSNSFADHISNDEFTTADFSVRYPISANNYDPANTVDTVSGYRILTCDTTVSWALSGDVYVDLNGNDLTGTIDLNGYTLYGMDSATDDYTCNTLGYFQCVDENGAEIVPPAHWKTTEAQVGSIKRYLTIDTADGYTFHRFYMGITHVSLKPTASSVGYKAVFAGDEMVLEQIDGYGYTLQLGDYSPRTVDCSRVALISEKPVSLRISNVDVENYGQTPVYAQVYLTVNGQTLYSAVCQTTIRQAAEQISANANDFSSEQLAMLKEWLQQFPVTQSWALDNIL